MSRWRIAVVVALLVLPFAALAAVGSYYLWTLKWGFWAWWPLAACMAAGYLLGLYWQRKKRLLRPAEFGAALHWTERDAGAWKLVEAKAKAGAELPPTKLSEIAQYLATAQELAQELAAYYHPGAKDPVGKLTLPEVLAVVELSSHDLAEMVDRYLPGGHLLTINDWKRARQLTDWYATASNLYWVAAALFDPIQTGLRYAAARVGLSEPMKALQQNLLLWFYTAFVHRLGNYLIELNSGRLRVGAARYRQLLGELAGPAPAPPAGATAPPASPARPVTVTLMGQVKAGKSSLVNALLGERRALTDVLPATAEVQRYELKTPEAGTPVQVLDTVGYGHQGPRADQLSATREAARQSDVVLLVLHARNPAREADLKMLRGLRDWFAANPDLKRPPTVAVLSHVDLLSPALEWAPPYDWRRPDRPKEVNIRDAVGAAREQVGEFVADVVPVCTAAGKEWGVDEGLLPALALQMDQARGVALLRNLRAEVHSGKYTKALRQMLDTGKEAARIAWQRFFQGQEALPPGPPGLRGRQGGDAPS